MNRLKISESQRDAMRSFHSLAVDDRGDEVMVGLSREASEWMLWYEETYGLGRVRAPSHDEKEKHQVLHQLHERARLQAIARRRD